MRTRSVAAVAALVAAVVLFWALRIVAPGRGGGLPSADLRLYFYPTYESFFALVAAGEWPRWNPYLLCGVPWLGLLEGGFLYPPHLLYALLPTPYALATLGLAHLLFAAVTMALFVRRLGFAPASAVVGTLLFVMRGSMVEWVRWPSLLEAASWLPLGALGVVGIARAESRRGAAALAAAMAASWLAGGPQATVYVVYVWTSLLPAVLVADGAPRARWGRALLLYATALGTGTLAAGAQLVPSFEMASEGLRSAASLDPRRLFPFGVPGADALLGLLPRSGVVPVLMAYLVVAALLARRVRAFAAWALVASGLVFTLALGPVTPAFRLFYVLPLLSWFRTPGRLLLVADFCLAVAAAAGCDVVLGRQGAVSPRARWVALVAGAAMMLLVATIGPGPQRLAVAVPAALAVGVLAVALRGRRTAVATVGLVGAAVFVAPAHESLLPYTRAAAAAYETARPLYEALARLQGPDRVWLLHVPPLPAVGFAPRLASRYRVRSIDDYEAITLRRQAEYFTFLLEGRTATASPTRLFMGMLSTNMATVYPGSFVARRRLLDLAAVRLVATATKMLPRSEVRALIATTGLVEVARPMPDVVVFENPHALPRAAVVYRTETAPPPATLLARLADPAFDPLATSYVEGAPLPPNPAAPPGHAARIVEDGDDAVEIEATLAAPGLVVLADAYYPGWRATVDGAPAAIVPTNHLFRGVVVPPGTHRVRFAYGLASQGIGLAASAVGVLVIALLVMRAPAGA